MIANWKDKYRFEYPFSPNDKDIINVDFQELLEERGLNSEEITGVTMIISPNEGGEVIEDSGRDGFVIWATISNLIAGQDYYVEITITTENIVLQRSVGISCRER